MSQRWYIVRGRSIDGTVYAISGGWIDWRPAAERMTLEMANARVETQRERNRKSNVDDIVGHLTVLLQRRRPRRKGKHRAEAYAAGCEFMAGTPGFKGKWDPRRWKRAERAMGMDNALMLAHYAGEADGHYGQPKRNPYPPGKRSAAYEGGYEAGVRDADPMGDWHGRNA